ncbi:MULTISPECIES: LysR family transcriptional regulator [unclassified Sphingobacterium]|uniref:LysR family transcriptional regulator n=1 Tax=unclassified Sphingobacterium TaxID=2609468 RepID=UPI0025D31B40|nr:MULTISPECIES: LysR family transcriptional regulator [unclassified Sphingobacterium]
MDFDFRLIVFYTAAQHLNFTKTASALFISQPAVSKNIQELEKRLGIPLFERKEIISISLMQVKFYINMPNKL